MSGDTTLANTGAAFYGKRGSTYVISLVGEIRYTMGCSLDEFLDGLFKRGDFEDIVVDLTETTFIDSTNLGLLAKVANVIRKRFGRKTTLVSTNEDINQILDSVGFQQVFDIVDNGQTEMDKPTRIPLADPRKEELAKTLTESHHRLCNINAANRDMFAEVGNTVERRVNQKD